MLWEIEIHPADGQTDREGCRVRTEAERTRGSFGHRRAGRPVVSGRGDRRRIAGPTSCRPCWRMGWSSVRASISCLGPTGRCPWALEKSTAVAQRAVQAGGDGQRRRDGRRKHWPIWASTSSGSRPAANTGSTATRPMPTSSRLSAKVLANDSIERVIAGPLPLETIALGSEYRFAAANGAAARDGRRRTL